MDHPSLKRFLDEGLSLAEIGRRVGRHEATVSYWVKKHGLEAANHEKHEAKGGLTREELSQLVDAGKSIAEIADAVGRSKPTVRHWLARHGLKTHGALGRRERVEAARAREAGIEVTMLHCKHHGETAFVLDQRGYYRCKRCRSASVSRRRRRVKELLVAEAGGACCVCGYSRNARALHFHHLDPSLKRMEINAGGGGVAIGRLREEARKCVVLCANCHAEVEAGLVSLASDGSVSVECASDSGSDPG
jgi:transposase